MPRHSGDEARDSFQGEAQYLLAGARCWQMNPDHGFHLDNARRDLDQSPGATCRTVLRATWSGVALTVATPHQPVRARVQEQTKLMAEAFVQDVRSAARCVFHDLMWFSAWPRRQ